MGANACRHGTVVELVETHVAAGGFDNHKAHSRRQVLGIWRADQAAQMAGIDNTVVKKNAHAPVGCYGRPPTGDYLVVKH